MTRANQYAPTTTSTGFRCRSGRSKLLPLKIGVQAIKPSPYRTGPPTPPPRHLSPAVGFLACSGPLHLSDPGKPSDPAVLPSSLSHLRWECDRAPRGALVQLRDQEVATAAFGQVLGVVTVGVDGVGGGQGIGHGQIIDRRGEGGGLAALGLDLDLPEDDPAALCEHRPQMRLSIPTTPAARAGVGATAGAPAG